MKSITFQDRNELLLDRFKLVEESGEITYRHLEIALEGKFKEDVKLDELLEVGEELNLWEKKSDDRYTFHIKDEDTIDTWLDNYVEEWKIS